MAELTDFIIAGVSCVGRQGVLLSEQPFLEAIFLHIRASGFFMRHLLHHWAPARCRLGPMLMSTILEKQPWQMFSKSWLVKFLTQ